MLDEKKLSYYIGKSKTLQPFDAEKKIRIVILGSFTLNGLEEVLRVKCSEIQIQCNTYLAAYNQYNQEILNSQSELYKFSPDITFLIIDTRSILGELFFSPYLISIEERKKLIENKLQDILNLVKIFCSKSQSKLVICNFTVPTYSPYGIIENKTQYSLQEMVYDLNEKLRHNLISEPSVFIFDFNGFVAKYGERNVFDYRQYFYGDVKISFDYLPYFANELMGYVKSVMSINKKCIVLDLDNTLWGGIVGEDGFNGIKLGNDPLGKSFVEFQRHLVALHQRGIILAINSKNNWDDAMKVISDHPNMVLREKHFACMKINWDDKISNFKDISQELNIGLDSMVFFDDDPVNREIVRMNLPEILTVDLPQDPSYYVQTLLELNDFHVLKITEEDKKRGEMYLQQQKRIELGKNAKNLDEFLKKLDIKVTIKKADEFTIPRISQLTLKTNQFNLTTHRYQEEDIRNFSKDPKKIVGCTRVEDKFGDNGITGVYIINKDNDVEWTIDSFLLSCRIIGRGVEYGILDHIIQKAKKEGVKKIKGKYIPTKKNKPAENFLPDFGFTKENDFWVYSTDKPVKRQDHLMIKIE